MDKYLEEDMKSYSNCSNVGEINIDLSNLFCYKLCLSPSYDNINNLKDYEALQKNKQYDNIHSQHDDTQPNDVTVVRKKWSLCKKK